MSGERSAASTGQVQSLVRALGALEKLAEHPHGQTLTELAKATGLPRSTTHRLLTTMHSLRFVIFDNDSNRWMVGPQALSVGAAFGGVRDLARLGRPFLRMLNMTSKEAVNLVIADDHHQIYVGQHRAKSITAPPVQPGDRLPLHLGAAGKSMMAFWRDDELDAHLRTTDFTKRTERSNTDAGRLVEKLKVVRERGYAFDCEENMVAVRCVGAPVFDAFGEPAGALSISAQINRMEKPRMHALGRELRAAALKLTNSLGGKVPHVLYG
ncbi:MAG: IclR family transcriptional regulator [Caulobacterales bacterium]|nr:IclR family transcriptional regulator [Caulobacterales bacterium]